MSRYQPPEISQERERELAATMRAVFRVDAIIWRRKARTDDAAIGAEPSPTRTHDVRKTPGRDGRRS